MKRLITSMALWSLLLLPFSAYGIGFEVAVGGWYQSPSGDVASEAVTGNDVIDLEDDMDLDDELRVSARAKIETPILIPNVYVMYSAMEFEGTGQKDVSFTYGDETFNANVDFDSEVKMDHIDAALYYSLPLVQTASLNTLNIDLGLNVRLYDIEAEITQGSISESESIDVPVPMLFAALQFRPIEALAFEAEGRGIAYDDNHVYSLIGRIKYNVYGPFFAAGGYRYESIEYEDDDFEVDVSISGPFAEVGVQF